MIHRLAQIIRQRYAREAVALDAVLCRREIPFGIEEEQTPVIDIDDCTQVYGDDIDPNTLPFDFSDMCPPHEPACDCVNRTLHCAVCGEVL